MGRRGRRHQQRGWWPGTGRGRLLRLRRAAYRAAWVYLCAWIAAVSLGRLPHPLEVASLAPAVAALLLIVAVLIEPRPKRGSVAPRDGATLDL